MSSPTRQRATALLAAAGTVSAVAACAAAAPARTAAAHPRLTLTATSPPAVAGKRFSHGARVTVTFTGAPGERRVRHVRASGSGSFSVAFRHAQVGHCGGFSVRAQDGRGLAASVHVQRPACMID